MKDTWTKPKWVVEARDGGGFSWDEEGVVGENTDNCN